MGRKEKELALSTLTEKIKSNVENNRAELVAEYQGLTVAELDDLRKKLRPLKAQFKVSKNTISRLALKNAGLADFGSVFKGPTAVVIADGDPVATAKVLVDFTKDHAKLKIKAGLLGSKVLSEKDIKALAALPSKEVLIGKMLGSLTAPMRGLVNVLQGTTRNMVYVLEAVRKQKEQQSANA